MGKEATPFVIFGMAIFKPDPLFPPYHIMDSNHAGTISLGRIFVMSFWLSTDWLALFGKVT